MDQDKRTMIIQEIHYWKKNKLLPEQYCDFLLNLYGGEGETAASAVESRKNAVSKKSGWNFALALGVISIISIIVLNFNAFPLPMQITSGGVGVLLLLTIGIFMRKKSLPLAYLCLGAGCMLMLVVGEWLLMQYEMNDAPRALGYLTVCCVIWLVLGSSLRLAFLQLCGWVGILFVYSWLLAYRLEPLYGLQLQAAWSAVTVLSIWFGWLVRMKNRSMSRVFFIVGLLACFAPEIMTAVFGTTGAGYVAQAVLVGKIIVVGITLFVLRKRWIEWVVDR